MIGDGTVPLDFNVSIFLNSLPISDD
jgi:hypothetical protein